jgi:3-(3-hydroxy-phenyl)propionate hydroxylase
VHDRVIFIGDAAHQVSPFGARGANSGIQDAENLAWKLAAMLAGEGGEALIASYDIERTQAADENIGHSTRSTDFMSPHSRAERGLRDAVLALAPKAEFARRMVNSGRLSLPSVYDSPLSTPDEAPFAGASKLGAPLPDAPVTRPDGTPAHSEICATASNSLRQGRRDAAMDGGTCRTASGAPSSVKIFDRTRF